MKNALRMNWYRKARRLRRQGLSYKEIRETVPVAKSTLSLWLKDVELKPEHKQRLYMKQIAILSRGTPSQKERRIREVDAIIAGAIAEIKQPISDEAFKLFGAALYWAEGSKSNSFIITNSDPRLILFMVLWLKKVFNIDAAVLKARLNMYTQQNERDLKHFWSDLTGIPVANFGKSYLKPTNKGYKKNTLYYGTIQVYVPKGINMMHRVYGWTRAVLQNFENEVLFTERKWISLKETPRPVNLHNNDEKPL